MNDLVIKMSEAINDRKAAVEYFGNIAFAKKNLTGKELKVLADKYRKAYQSYLDVLSGIDDTFVVEWDKHQKSEQFASFRATFSDDEWKELVANSK